MRAFLRLLLLPVGRAMARRWPPEAHAPSAQPRRDFMRGAAGFPITLFFLSAAAAKGTGCAPAGTGTDTGGSTSLQEDEVANFTVPQALDGSSLLEVLRAYAVSQEVGLLIRELSYPDADDGEMDVIGSRLLRWGFVRGSSTDVRVYRFKVYDAAGELIGNVPGMDTILHTGYQVQVLESFPVDVPDPLA